ncbi:hypothetical protein Tco_0078592 [Tanacetum coccineum]
MVMGAAQDSNPLRSDVLVVLYIFISCCKYSSAQMCDWFAMQGPICVVKYGPDPICNCREYTVQTTAFQQGFDSDSGDDSSQFVKLRAIPANFEADFRRPRAIPATSLEYLENSSNAIKPDLSTEEPDNSLTMGDEHLDTNLETESDEVIKSSVDDLIPILSESKGISDDTCDVPFCDNSPPLDVLNNHFEIFSNFNDDCTLSDDDSFENIDYVEASPPVLDSSA